MRRFRFSRFLLVSVVMLTCVTSLIFFLLRDAKLRQKISDGFTDISLTVSSALTSPISSISSFWEDFKSIDNTRQENSDLQEKLLALDSYQEKLSDLQSENEALKASLNIQESFSEQVLLTAKIRSRSTVAWLDWITLNVGENEGVTEKMLVLSNGYLVGTVSQVANQTSTVILLTNTGEMTQIPVKISTTSGEVYGILSGYDIDKNAFLVTKLNKNVDISQDSQVLTSGLDGNTTANVKVGSVLEVASEDSLNRTVYVLSGADFDDLTYLNLIGESNDEN